MLLALASCNGGTDVLVVGGGASGICAGIQAARSGVRTIVVEEGPWLGGMLTSAGVSAIDGNYNLRGGLFGEFCDSLAKRYGGYDKLHSGWVSKIMFDPRTGASVLENMARRERRLELVFGKSFLGAEKLAKGWKVHFTNGYSVKTRVLVDGTELGDVAAACGAAYDKGNEDGVIQDLTMVLTVRDYGPGEDRTIECPEGYDRGLYVNCCLNPLNVPSGKGQRLWSPEDMLSYGRLPDGDIMLNWPIEGNDCYADMIEADTQRRQALRDSAAAISLGYLYFLQTELGFRSIGIAEGVYPTADGLPIIPYHRESRRIRGVCRFTLEDALDPYGTRSYMDGVAPGDYPVDHHHFRNPRWKDVHISYPPVPPFSVPLGVMIPESVEDLVVAEKSISVDFDINGATRLQPVVMELGQAAGVLAAIAVRKDIPVRAVPVRAVQAELLAAGARIQPYLDLSPGDAGFEALQRVGTAGIRKASFRSAGWRNESWMNISAGEAIELDKKLIF